MAALASVFVEVLPDTRRFTSELGQKLGHVDAAGPGKRAGHHFGTAFSGAAKGIIGGVAASVAALGVGRLLRESVVGFQAHQKVTAQTTAVLKSTGNAAGTSVSAIEKLSDALERKSTVDGDVIQSGANMLATFTNVQNRVGKGNDIFNRATSTVLDMSVALGQDTKSSAIQLGKALNDPVKGVTALQRVGVTFTKEQRDQIAAMVKVGDTAGAQKVILAELNKEFGGSAAAQGKAAGAQGRLIVAWRQAQDTIGKALLPVVNELEGAMADRLPGAAEKAARWIKEADVQVRNFIAGLQGHGPIEGFTGKLNTAGLGVRALIRSYKEGDVTSDGFVGAMERIGVSLGRIRDYLKTVDFHSLVVQVGAFIDRVRGTDVQQFGTQLSSIHAEHLGDAFRVAGVGIGFLADHIDLLVKALPFLIAAFAAYKATQAAANVVDVVSIPLKIAQVGANVLLARSIKALATSQVESTGATLINTAVTGASSAAIGISRGRILAQTAAMIIARGATLVWAAAQAVLNAVMTANPIGLIIVGIAALIGIIILVATKTKFFQTVWGAVWGFIKSTASSVWNDFLKPIFGAWMTVLLSVGRRFIDLGNLISRVWGSIKTAFQAGVRVAVDTFLSMVGAVINGAARAFGWVPGLGGKLREAAAKFNTFRDEVNTALAGVRDRTVSVGVQTLSTDIGGGRRVVVRREAEGGLLKSFAAGAEKHIAQIARPGEMRLWAEPETGGEAYIPLAGSKRGRSTKILSAVASSFGYGLTPMAAGGLLIDPSLRGQAQLARALAAFDAKVGDYARQVGNAVSDLTSGGNVVEFARRQAGKPYVWGASGPGGYDCSGFVSALVNVAQGRSPYSRRFSTGTLPAGLFAPGSGRFNIGWFTGNPGHVAATVNGVPMESRGGDGVVVGSRSRGAGYSYFTRHGHLIGFADGGIRLPGDPPFDLLDRRGKHYRPGLLDALKDAQRFGVKAYDQGGKWPTGTLGVNTSGGTETVRSTAMEDDLLAELRGLRADLARMPSGVGREVGVTIAKFQGGRR